MSPSCEAGFTAKPELVCPVEVRRRSLLPVGRIDSAVEAPECGNSGFALEVAGLAEEASPAISIVIRREKGGRGFNRAIAAQSSEAASYAVS